MSDGTIKLTVEGEFAKASDKPIMGDKRLVRYLPCGLPGTKAILLPCIWMSPWEIFDEDLKEKVKICILLLNDEAPKPDIVAVRIPAAAIHKFPTGPVAW